MNEDAIRQLTQALNANTQARMNPQGAGPRLGVPIGGGFSAFLGGAPGIAFFKKIITNSIELGIRQGMQKSFRDGSLKSKLETIRSNKNFAKTYDQIRTAALAGDVSNLPGDFNISRFSEIQEKLSENAKQQQLGKSKISTIQGQLEQEGARQKEQLGQQTSQGIPSNIRRDMESAINQLNDELESVVSSMTNLDEEFSALSKESQSIITSSTDEAIKRQETGEKISHFGTKIFQVAAFVGLLIKAFTGLRDSLIQTSQQLGGVSLGKAFEQRIDAFFASLRTGFTISSQRILETQGALGQEFGQLATTGSATELTKVAQSYGLTAQQLVGLERTLQSNALSASEALDAFTQQGILSGVAAEEMNKNMGAVARAGDKFNSFIVEGIKNAKRLGLEFGKIEQTLTGFATNFEGTIDQFAGLRAVIPGFETDFNQLFSTALYGSTDDFVEQIRTGLQGAGITSVAGMSRTALAQLEQSTGFTADQIDRILQNQDVNFDVQKDLDGNRNKLLKYILAGVGALVGAVAGVALTIGIGLASISFGLSLAPALATVAGVAAGYRLGSNITGDDIVSQPGYGERTLVTPTGNIALNNQDQLIAGTNLYGKGELSGPSQSSVSMQGVEVKLDKLYAAVERQTQALQRGLRTEITGIDKGLTQLKDAEDRGLVYG